MKYALPCAALFVVLGISTAQAQVVVDQAATAGESYARGVSGIISSQGQKNLDDSQARINNQDAYSQAIDNSIKSVNAYWEKKDIYNEHLQQELAVVQQKRERYIARRGSLDLSTEEFDRTTGQVNWPKVLEQSAFDQYRTQLDSILKERAYNGTLTGDQYMQATTTYNAWRAAILAQRDAFPAPIVQQMLRFLLKVNRELNDNLT
jgi:hypothetical protein